MDKLITFITAFKAFTGPAKAAQRSALFSYKANGIPVVAADTEGDAEAHCRRFPNVTLLRGVKTAEDIGFKNRAPILKGLLQAALEVVTTPYVGLINADILIPMGYPGLVKEAIDKCGDTCFIAVTRHDINLSKEVSTVLDLKRAFSQDAVVYDVDSSSDLFISFKRNFRDLAGAMPEFILGRYAWDNWMHCWAMECFPCFNGTKALKILHCRHTHDHIVSQEGRPGREAASSHYNIALLKPMQDKYGGSVNVRNWKEICL